MKKFFWIAGLLVLVLGMLSPVLANQFTSSAGTSYFYRDTINSTGLPTMANVVYLVNGTSGVNVQNQTEYIWSLAESVNTTNTVWFSNYTNFEVDNRSNVTLPFEVELGNRTGINSTQLYGNDELMHLRCGTNSTMCLDSTKYGVNGTIRSRTVWTNNGMVAGGVVAQGVIGGGEGNGLNFTYNSNLMKDLYNFTLIAWIKPRTTAGGTGSATQEMAIIGDHDTSKEGDILLEISKTQNGDVALLIDKLGTFTYCTSPNAPVQYGGNVWQMVAATYSQTNNNMSVFYNGSIIKSCTFAGQTPLNVTAGGFYVLRSGNPSYFAFNGTADEIIIMNRTMSENEIKAAYQMMTASRLGVLNTFSPDTTSPTYSNVNVVPSSPHFDNLSSLPVRFNATFNDDFGLQSGNFILGGTPYSFVPSSKEYNFSLVYNLSCGNTTYYWNITDTSGNANTTATYQYEHDCDLAAPVINGIATAPSSPLSNYLSSYPVQFNASINDNILVSSVTFNLSGVLYNFTPATASYAFSNVYNVSCGNTTYQWTATDGVGNGASSSPQVFSYNCDNAVPTYSAISTDPISPHYDNATGGHPVLFNMTARDNFQLSRIVFDLSGSEYEFNISGTEYNFSETLNVSCGSTTYHWHIYDARNNTNSTLQFAYQHNCDSEAPYVVIFEPVGNYANLTVPFDVFAINTVSMDVCWSQLDFAGIVPNPTCSNSTITTTEGGHTIYFYGNDSVGNVNFTYSNFFIDVSPPVILISSPPTVVMFNNNLPSYPILVVFTATDTGVNNVTCQYKLDAGAVGNTTCNQFTVNVTDFNTHSVTVYAIDSLGNNASAIVSFHVAIAGHAQVEGFTAIALRAVPFLFLGLLIFIGYMIMMAGQQENDMKRILSGFVVMLLGLIFFVAINSAVVIMTTAP